jgi:hypothetical protein
MVPTSDCARAATENKKRIAVTKGMNGDVVEQRAVIAGKVPILDIKRPLQTKDCSGAMLCASTTRFGRGLPGVYTGGFNGLTEPTSISPGMCSPLENCVEFTKL